MSRKQIFSSLEEFSQARLPDRSILQTDDERFIYEALKDAWKSFDEGEVPVGAICVQNNKIIARGRNQVELLQDATAHAELLAVGAASEALGGWRLNGITLYSTLEPCAMCAGALLLARVDRIVWGAPDFRHGANGSWVDLFAQKHPIHSITITSGILQEWCGRPMKEFFKLRRDEQKNRS